MTIKFDDIVSAFENAGLEPRSYSGRAMYGKHCLGVVCSNATTAVLETLEQFVLFCVGDKHAVIDQITEFCQTLKDPRTDQLGHDKIVYWPSIVWEETAADPDFPEESEFVSSIPATITDATELGSKSELVIQQALTQGFEVVVHPTLPSIADLSGVLNVEKKS